MCTGGRIRKGYIEEVTGELVFEHGLVRGKTIRTNEK